MNGRRVDLNHGEIRDGLRECGYIVEDMSAVGHGFPDLLVGANAAFVLLEVKRPGEELTPRELRFHAKFAQYPVYVVTSLEDALSRLGEVWRQ
jgi:hypothetical protein